LEIFRILKIFTDIENIPFLSVSHKLRMSFLFFLEFSVRNKKELREKLAKWKTNG